MTLTEETVEKLLSKHIYRMVSPEAYVNSMRQLLETGADGTAFDMPDVTLDNIVEVEEVLVEQLALITEQKRVKLESFTLDELLDAIHHFGFESGQDSAFNCFPQSSEEISLGDYRDEVARRVNSLITV